MSEEEPNLQKRIKKEEDLILDKISRTSGFILKLQQRKDNATDETEKQRLQQLIDRHTAHRDELLEADVVPQATQRFNKEKLRYDRNKEREDIKKEDKVRSRKK